MPCKIKAEGKKAEAFKLQNRFASGIGSKNW